jgi:RNA polymerase sigma factor (sigma-70 family)
MPSVIEHLRRMACGVGLRDGELLGRFVERRDEAALAALVNRHGPMVWGVCRRLLGHHDAEDAFQATFIVLVKKASSIGHRELVGNWLYGVAHQIALQARRAASRRKEVQVTEMPDAEAPQDRWHDLQPLLDEELSRLPDHYRAVIVLCDLEGKTRKEVAAQLGCPEGTVASRLVRARSMLARRLTQRGVALSGGVLAAALSRNVASAGVPASVVSSTIKAANLCAAGQAAAPVKVAALAEGVMKAMLMSKLKAAIAVALVLGLMAIGATVLTSRTASAQGDNPPRAEEQVKAQLKVEEKADAAVVWGKEAGGLQAGIVGPGVVRIGEKARFIVKLRNVSKETIKVSAWPLWTCYPGVVDATGKRVPTTTAPAVDFEILPKALTLKPGQTVDVGRSDLPVAEPDQKVTVPDGVVDFCAIHVTPGKYTAGCVGFLKENHTLATATVEFEVKPAKESITAWGKEVGGLQAGLRIAEKRAYHTGEEVTVSLWVRNVGKEAVEFRHIWAFFVENPPTITGPDGKTIPLPKLGAEGQHGPRSPGIAPGKEIDLYDWKFQLRPSKWLGNDGVQSLYGTGTFNLQCERIVGPTSANPDNPNPAMAKLATGKLELEVMDKAPPGKTDGPSGNRVSDASPDPKSEYPTADIVVQYHDDSGRDLKQFRVDDAAMVAKLASHFPGILGDRGSGPRTSAGKRATFTIRFNHKSGEVSRVRVAHVTADFATWWWRDNTPYTGDREVERKDQLKSLMERLAEKNKVDLK